MGPGQLKGVRRPLPVGSPISDDRRAPGSVLSKTSVALCYESPSHRWLFLTWKRISSPAEGAAFTDKEGLYKERVPIRAQADYVLCQGNWRKINYLRTIGSALCIVDPKSESRSWDIFSRSTPGVVHFLCAGFRNDSY